MMSRVSIKQKAFILVKYLLEILTILKYLREFLMNLDVLSVEALLIILNIGF